MSVCDRCGGDGVIPVSSGNSPYRVGSEPCPACSGPDGCEPVERERDADDGQQYGDPGDEMERRLLED